MKLICLHVGLLISITLPLTLFNGKALIFSMAVPVELEKPEGSQTQAKSLKLFEIPQMPVKLGKVSLANEFLEEINYSLTTSLKGEVIVQLKVFYFDDRKKLKLAEDHVVIQEAKAGSWQEGSFDLEDEVKDGDSLVVAVYEVTTPSGVWSVDATELETEVKNSVARRPQRVPYVRYNQSLSLTDEEKATLYRLALEQVINDKESLLLLLYPGNPEEQFSKVEKKKPEAAVDKPLVLSTTNLSSLPAFQLPEAKLKLLSLEKIQQRANATDTFTYLTFDPVEIEGSKVFITLRSRKAVKPPPPDYKGPAVYGDCCNRLLFKYERIEGQWVGGRQSVPPTSESSGISKN
jgi:hypothetical protein